MAVVLDPGRARGTSSFVGVLEAADREGGAWRAARAGDVLRVDVRKTDGARTALLLGGIAGAATLGIVAALEGGNPGQGPNGGGPPPEQIVRWIVGVPLIRF